MLYCHLKFTHLSIIVRLSPCSVSVVRHSVSVSVVAYVSYSYLVNFLPASSLKCTMSSNSSTMWKYFDKCDNGGLCKLCRMMVKTCGNTTNLKQHLKRKHSSININVSASACKSARSDPIAFENDEDDPSIVQSTVIFMI